MTRKVSLILAIVMLLSLCACSKVPEDFTKETYEQGRKALEVMDKYLSGKMNAGEAEERDWSGICINGIV